MPYILPALYVIDEHHKDNTLQALLLPSETRSGEMHAVQGYRHPVFELSSPDFPAVHIWVSTSEPPAEWTHVVALARKNLNDGLPMSDLTQGSWMRHPQKPLLNTPEDIAAYARTVRTSWAGQFHFKAEDPASGAKGLRQPQLGAIHAIQAHWTIDHTTATLAMPTGTGKTETMISVMVLGGLHRVLVIVPTDALRVQIARKFVTFGLLQEPDFQVIGNAALRPVVGTLKNRFQDQQSARDFISQCNVIVTTAQVAGQLREDVQLTFAQHCSHLFVDEAHHATATTWQALIGVFERHHKPVLQYTATPFREKGESVGGKIIYSYPLSKAQQEGYFKQINFKPVAEYNQDRIDAAIALQAVQQLQEDRTATDTKPAYDHILMARCGSISKAKQVYGIYQDYPEFHPVIIHSEMTAKQRDEAKEKILNRESRIVVCVDMFGEGFDLPNLKIAAFHDIRKSLAITLQFAGRFTRTSQDRELGNATFIANIGQVEVREALEDLYKQNPDWNQLLPILSQNAIQAEQDLRSLIEGFPTHPGRISLQNIRTALSTVIYQQCEAWNPEEVNKVFEKGKNCDELWIATNHTRQVQVVVTAQKIRIDWLPGQDVHCWEWQLYVLHWEPSTRHLYIHGSDTDSHYKTLAQAVGGPQVRLLCGNQVFRSLGRITRLQLQNVGLLKHLGGFIRYNMSAGPDVEQGVPHQARQQSQKANIFGVGYENGERTSMGCSYKGRMWSRKVGSLDDLLKFFQQVGDKVLDTSINPDDVLRGTIVPMMVGERPAEMPVALDWPDCFYEDHSTTYRFEVNGRRFDPDHTALCIHQPSREGHLVFEFEHQDQTVLIEMALSQQGNEYHRTFRVLSGQRVEVSRGSRTITTADAVEFFERNPPRVIFADGSVLKGNEYTRMIVNLPQFLRERIEVWDWTGINIQRESQYSNRDPLYQLRTDSVQYRVIQNLLQEDHDIVMDDDDAGESADVVTIKRHPDRLEIVFYHCKYAGGPNPGERIDDLYEVCGQAQKSIRWKTNIQGLFDHLLKRDHDKQTRRNISRLERGTADDLRALREYSRMVRTNLTIAIVQPGLSQQDLTDEQQVILSVTDCTLAETYQLPFRVIASP